MGLEILSTGMPHDDGQVATRRFRTMLIRKQVKPPNFQGESMIGNRFSHCTQGAVTVIHPHNADHFIIYKLILGNQSTIMIII